MDSLLEFLADKVDAIVAVLGLLYMHQRHKAEIKAMRLNAESTTEALKNDIVESSRKTVKLYSTEIKEANDRLDREEARSHALRNKLTALENKLSQAIKEIRRTGGNTDILRTPPGQQGVKK